MDVLVPIDGSACSTRALRFAAEFADRHDASLHVVHFADRDPAAAEELFAEAREILEEAGIEDEPEVVSDAGLGDPRYGNRVGKDILELVEERGYDHVVMGHHGSGMVGRAILGSAAETVIRAAETPATVIP